MPGSPSARHKSRPPLPIIAQIGFEFAITRLILVLVAVLAFVALPSVTGPEYHHVSTNLLVDLWSRWDSAFYVRIALSGYSWQWGPVAANSTFFPVLPALISFLIKFNPAADRPEAIVAGVLISNLALFLAVLCLDALVRLDERPVTAANVRWLVWLSPMSIFFSGVYTESLLLLFSVLAIYSARRDRWLAAGLAAFIAGLTRPVGFVVFIPLLFIAWRSAPLGRRVAALVAPLAAPAFYVSLVGLSAGNPSAYFAIGHSIWNRGLSLPWNAFLPYFSGPLTLLGWERSFTDLAFTLAYLTLALLVFRFSKAYGWYALALLALPVLTGTLLSMPRYGAVAFPVYLVVARWMGASRWRRWLGWSISFALSVIVTARFVTWRWVA